MDFVFVILAFCGLGWLLDQVLGTQPWCTIGGLTFGVVGQFVRMWYSYDADMRQQEQRLFEGRRR
jgi:F0F1-type ATP synthase assembly protein I